MSEGLRQERRKDATRQVLTDRVGTGLAQPDD